MTSYDSIDSAVARIAAGAAVVVIDDLRPDGEGSLVLAAESCTTELLAFMVRHTSGYVSAALDAKACERLALVPMAATDQDGDGAVYTVTVDASMSIGTGISAADRATTIRLLADDSSAADDFNRPGHVVPLRTRDGGVLTRPAHPEAAVDLARMAGCAPAGVLCGIVGIQDPTRMATASELRLFADQYGMPMISISDLIAWRRQHEKQVRRVAENGISTAHGQFRAIGYLTNDGRDEHTALTLGDISGASGAVAVAIHTQCSLGDVFGSLGCRCASQLETSMAQVALAEHGVVVYLRGPCGTSHHGHIDPSSYVIAGQILDDLGVTDARCTRAGQDRHLVESGFLPVSTRYQHVHAS
ncbi:MAG TPA: 3,4-dihydroxy-2-butanone-4-phosphate synthase [Mycobacterium sp.]|nr:3,4-dihydroxy-2-butanone-4-phosphate synthase [Mycobacterium sp.]